MSASRQPPPSPSPSLDEQYDEIAAAANEGVLEDDLALVEAAASRVEADPGAPFEVDVVLAMRRLRDSQPDHYERALAVFKAAKVPLKRLQATIDGDRVTKRKNGEHREHKPSPAWMLGLQLTEKGSPRGNLFNVMHALEHAPELAGALAWNQFTLRPDILRPLPWSPNAAGSWQDTDTVHLTRWLQGNGIGAGIEITRSCLVAMAQSRQHHPVRDWLTSMTWDRTRRIDNWLSYYLGVEVDITTDPEHAAYVRAVGRRWLISAVARVFQPGCKTDHVLVLEGAQGIGKSSALRVLVGADWFTDELADFGSKDAAMQLVGIWLVELSELDHLGRAAVTRIKQFLPQRVDRFRPPYGDTIVYVPRQCLFAGTVNDSEYLADKSGNRRFWPVACGTIDLDALAADRAQLWAEAVVAYRAGEVWWLDDAALQAAAIEQQEQREFPDPTEEAVQLWAASRLDGFLLSELFDGLNVPVERRAALAGSVGRILRKLGYRKAQGDSRATPRPPRRYYPKAHPSVRDR